MVLKNPDQIIDFGQKGSKTYIDHGNEKKRSDYIARHGKEDWTKLNPGSASRFILWGNSTDIKDNLQEFIYRFGLDVPPGAKIIL